MADVISVALDGGFSRLGLDALITEWSSNRRPRSDRMREMAIKPSDISIRGLALAIALV
jgi:hypothetical protein